MIIPGFIIAILTFPGVIVHELAHQAFCKLTGTPVYKVCYFRVGNPAGYVIHGPARNVWQHLLIGVGPFIFNTIVGLFLGLLAFGLHVNVHDLAPAGGILLWLAISIAMHSFPSTGDAKSIWRAIWSPGVPILARVVGLPLIFIIFAGAVGSIFWLDVIYGVGVVVGLPALMVR